MSAGAVPSSSSLRVRDLRAELLAGLLCPSDVARLVLERLRGRDDDGVWISRVPERDLLARARVLDRLDPDGLPLLGIPFAVKDNIDTAGLDTTAGCPAFAYRPTRDATAVRRLLDAGALLVGKTNLDQFATGLTGTRSPYGACESVYGGDLVAGGSSSGSAVAVAAGLVPFALGTDTAGSGRVPAALNGVVGLKPSRGLVSTTGVVPACRSLDCVSIFTTTIEDADDVLAVLAGSDPADPWSRTAPAIHAAPAPRGLPLPRVRPESGVGREPLRLALPEAGDLDADPGVLATFARFAATAVRASAGVVRVALRPFLEAGDLLYEGPWVAERLAGLEAFLDEHPDDVLPVTRAVLDGGRAPSAVDAFRGMHRLRELRAECDRVWERADVLLLPTVPTTFTRAQIRAEPVARNLVLGRFTQFANLLDLAAVAVPGGMTTGGRPVGVTLLGPAFTEGRLLSAAHRFTVQEAA